MIQMLLTLKLILQIQKGYYKNILKHLQKIEKTQKKNNNRWGKNIYNKLIWSLKKNEIIIPTYKGQQRNPILFSKSMKKKIIEINGDAGAKKILENKKNKVLKIEIDDENIFKDFNTKDNFSS